MSHADHPEDAAGSRPRCCRVGSCTLAWAPCCDSLHVEIGTVYLRLRQESLERLASALDGVCADRDQLPSPGRKLYVDLKGTGVALALEAEQLQDLRTALHHALTWPALAPSGEFEKVDVASWVN